MFMQPDDPRDIREEDFPRSSNRNEQLRFLLNYAVLAPSSHNSQPWLFRLREDGLDVLADRTRGLPVVDPHDRELTISCGAAIGTLEVAARGFGLFADVEAAPSEDADLIARVRLANGDAPTRDETLQFKAIKRRHTDRSVYSTDTPPSDLLDHLARDAAPLNVEVRHVTDEALKAQIAELVDQGDRVQFDDPHFRRELASWVHSRRLGSRDGMSASSFGIPDVLAPAARFVIRTFDMGKGIAAADAEKIMTGSPVLSLLSTPTESAEAWTETGRALARMLISLTSQGVCSSYLNQPIEVEALRPKLKEIVGTAQMPQLLLRIGYGEGGVLSVRRPVSGVMVE